MLTVRNAARWLILLCLCFMFGQIFYILCLHWVHVHIDLFDCVCFLCEDKLLMYFVCIGSMCVLVKIHVIAETILLEVVPK